MRELKRSDKNLKLFEIIDAMQIEMTRIDDNFYVGKPNRLDILESASKQIEQQAQKMQEHIQSMRRMRSR